MPGLVPFTDNYADHSTEAGYQFEFFCERCGNGYKSGFDASAVGVGTSIARGLGGILGGVFGDAEQVGQQARDMTESTAKDKALRDAIKEVEPYFTQCHKCGQWVCVQVCWNDGFNLCVGCAPKMEQELAGAQAQRALQQMQEKVAAADYIGDMDVSETQKALCPHCGEETQVGAKFCGECGKTLATALTCGSCQSEAPAGTKFCPNCGTKL